MIDATKNVFQNNRKSNAPSLPIALREESAMKIATFTSQLAPTARTKASGIAIDTFAFATFASHVT